MAVPGQLGSAEIGEGRVELDVAREHLPARTHQRIKNVIANSSQRSRADQAASAGLRPVAADRGKAGMAGGQPHFRPNLEGRSAGSVTAAHISLIGTVVVKQVEFDEFDALVFEIEESAIDS